MSAAAGNEGSTGYTATGAGRLARVAVSDCGWRGACIKRDDCNQKARQAYVPCRLVGGRLAAFDVILARSGSALSNSVARDDVGWRGANTRAAGTSARPGGSSKAS